MTPEPLLTARQVGEILGFKAGTIVDWSERGEIPSFHVGGRLRFRWSEVDAWLEAKRAGARGEAPTAPQRPPGVVSAMPTVPQRGGHDDA